MASPRSCTASRRLTAPSRPSSRARRTSRGRDAPDSQPAAPRTRSCSSPRRGSRSGVALAPASWTRSTACTGSQAYDSVAPSSSSLSPPPPLLQWRRLNATSSTPPSSALPTGPRARAASGRRSCMLAQTPPTATPHASSSSRAAFSSAPHSRYIWPDPASASITPSPAATTSWPAPAAIAGGLSCPAPPPTPQAAAHRTSASAVRRRVAAPTTRDRAYRRAPRRALACRPAASTGASCGARERSRTMVGWPSSLSKGWGPCAASSRVHCSTAYAAAPPAARHGLTTGTQAMLPSSDTTTAPVAAACPTRPVPRGASTTTAACDPPTAGSTVQSRPSPTTKSRAWSTSSTAGSSSATAHASAASAPSPPSQLCMRLQ